VSFQEQKIPKGKYSSPFSCQMEACVYSLNVFTTHTKKGKLRRPVLAEAIYSVTRHLHQLHMSKNISWIVIRSVCKCLGDIHYYFIQTEIFT